MLNIALVMSCGLFLVSSLHFIFKEKSSILIHGYYFISKNQRELYDEFKLSKDYGIILLKYGLILFIGALGSIFISELILWISFAIWIIYFVKTLVTFNFDKYKIN
ncbi:Domain of unknown function (DUF3784) [[Clostridium] sordellii]|uniref:DUF3784 domain-containing protein n=1 Tax=Paraclostridium sordellii TaxID=1505 RepID=UPI000541FE84|nr:DUF3784 domain-containing protein [Paeniclostridium sordellii]CEK35500.1 Domain of unknown function (DUF3784) [[Clostridium] sordellii] [Paeniclostridium sordellii]